MPHYSINLRHMGFRVIRWNYFLASLLTAVLSSMRVTPPLTHRQSLVGSTKAPFLGSQLLLVYIGDLPLSPSSNAALSVDDVATRGSDKDRLQPALNKTSRWPIDWSLPISDENAPVSFGNGPGQSLLINECTKLLPADCH